MATTGEKIEAAEDLVRTLRNIEKAELYISGCNASFSNAELGGDVEKMRHYNLTIGTHSGAIKKLSRKAIKQGFDLYNQILVDLNNKA